MDTSSTLGHNKKSIFVKPSLHQGTGHVSCSPQKKKHKIIKWDEVTIAEHDKERGSRQKIDEAPTPYRYGSESDQSEAESGSSDGEHLSRRRKLSTGSYDHEDSGHTAVSSSGVTPMSAATQQALASKYASNSVLSSWETVHAKLTYEKHLQDLEQKGEVIADSTNPYSNSTQQNYQSGSASSAPISSHPGEFPFLMQHSTHNGEDDEYDDRSTAKVEGEPDWIHRDPPTTEFGEIITPPPPPSLSSRPSRPALKLPSNYAPLTSTSLLAATGSSPTKLLIKRSTSQENSSHVYSSSVAGKPSKSVHIRTATNVGEGIGGHVHGHQHTPSPAPAQKTYFRYSNPDGAYSTDHSALFAGINASMGGGHSGEEEEEDGEGTSEQREVFRNKRAGHYNEFKVLQAMRAKMMEEEEDEDGDESDRDSFHTKRPNTNLSPCLPGGIVKDSMEIVNGSLMDTDN